MISYLYQILFYKYQHQKNLNHVFNKCNLNIKKIFIKNTKSRSKENISKHYDLGNEFFSLWLDKTLTYSSAIFEKKTQDLSEAQNNKYQKLINLINPKNGDKVLIQECKPFSKLKKFQVIGETK